MNLYRIYFGMLIAVSFLFTQAGFSDPAQAPTDNYSQGVSLFKNNEYLAALPFFQKAVQDDPKNAQAYYYLGSCQELAGDLRDEVLNYYISNKLSPDAGMKAYADKMNEKLSPEDQDWVEKQFEAFSQPVTQPTSLPFPSSSGADYSQAVSLYNAKEYQAALPLFQQVVLDDPGRAQAYYYLGSCQQKAGYLRGEALNFYISDRLHPYPALKICADKVMEKLSPEDQDWVAKHLDAFSSPAIPPQTTSLIPAASMADHVGLGVHFSIGSAFYNLADFQSEMAFINYVVDGYKSANPSYGYNLQTSVASFDGPIELNPYVAFGQDGELGAAFNFWPTTSVSYLITASIDPRYSVRSEWDLNSFELLLKGRWYFPRETRGVRFFLEPSAGLQPVDIHHTYTYAYTSATPSSGQTGWDAGGVGFDTGLNLGAAFTLSPGTVFSFSGGYQLDAVSGFKGTWNDGTTPSRNGTKGSLQMYTDPSTEQRSIVFIPDDPNMLSAFGENSSIWAYCRPLSVDQSGLRFRADISCSF